MTGSYRGIGAGLACAIRVMDGSFRTLGGLSRDIGNSTCRRYSNCNISLRSRLPILTYHTSLHSRIIWRRRDYIMALHSLNCKLAPTDSLLRPAGSCTHPSLRPQLLSNEDSVPNERSLFPPSGALSAALPPQAPSPSDLRMKNASRMLNGSRRRCSTNASSINKTSYQHHNVS